MSGNIRTSIQPWLTVVSAERAAAFYTDAFQAVETYRLSDPSGGLVVKLSINGAIFWISSEASNADHASPVLPGDNNIRMILIEEDPDALFARALNAGATEVFPVGEEHGWRLGRLSDPFGMHWEIGHELS